MVEQKTFHMNRAMALAQEARTNGEVPVGAVVVRDDDIIGRGSNSMIGISDCTAHAEVVALRDAGRRSGNYRLSGSDLYVTLEPCLMCYAAMVQARIGRLFYGAADPKTGIFSTGAFRHVSRVFNHAIQVESGILEQESSEMLKGFFKERRDAGAVERDGLENR